MTENEADWAEVLILTASPMIIPQPTTPPPLVHAQTQTWFMKAFRSALRFDFLAVALLHQTDTYRGWKGGGFTAISLAFYLSFKSFQAWCDNSAAGVHERRMMILSDDDVNVGKVRGRVTEELPEAETPSTWDRPELLGPHACGRGWHHRVRWQHLYLPRLHYTEGARTITAFFICLEKPLPSTNHIWQQNTT